MTITHMLQLPYLSQDRHPESSLYKGFVETSLYRLFVNSSWQCSQMLKVDLSCSKVLILLYSLISCRFGGFGSCFWLCLTISIFTFPSAKIIIEPTWCYFTLTLFLWCIISLPVSPRINLLPSGDICHWEKILLGNWEKILLGNWEGKWGSH